MRLNMGGHAFFKYDGYGRLVSGTAQFLIRAGHEVYPFELRDLKEKPSWMLAAQQLTFDRLTLQFAPPSEFQHIPGRSACITMHESTWLPKGWSDHINGKNQLAIVPHQWLAEVLIDCGVKIPIEVLTFGIDPEECPLLGQRKHGAFTFLCLGDRGDRKGWDLAHAAFYKAFDHRNKDVRLIIKARPGSLDKLDSCYSNDERLTVWRADVPDLADIYAQCDAYICPTRCEGLGMTPREAAACGVPTVVTRWSGTDDETDKWAIPLDDFKLIDSRMQECGGLWAEPSLDELCEKMLWLYENRDEAKANALRGAQWLRANRTYAQTADNLIGVLQRHFGGQAPRLQKSAPTQADIAANERVIAALEAVAPHSNGHALAVNA